MRLFDRVQGHMRAVQRQAGRIGAAVHAVRNRAAGSSGGGVMHKGITLQLLVTVEGEQRAAEDFEALAIDTVRQVIAAGAAAVRSDLRVEVVHVSADGDAAADADMQHA